MPLNLNGIVSTLLNTKLLNMVGDSFVRLNTAGRFYNPNTGRLGSNEYGLGVSAVRDVIQIAIPMLPSFIDESREE